MTNLLEHIDLNKHIENVRNKAQQYPDAVYQRADKKNCFYTKGKAADGDGCIHGQAADDDFKAILKEIDMQGGAPIDAVLAIHGLILNEDLRVNWCSIVQEKQDYGAIWSDSVTAADKEYPQVTT